MSDVTRILGQIESGDGQAADKLLPVVYDELRKLAAARMTKEDPGQTLQATALVHEAYIRLVDNDKAQHWNSRGHFYGAAAEAMRRILVDHAREKQAMKRGGDLHRVELTDLPQANSNLDLVALDEALDELAVGHPEKARLVSLRFFAGRSLEEAAETVGVSRATAQRYWSYARAWVSIRGRCGVIVTALSAMGGMGLFSGGTRNAHGRTGRCRSALGSCVRKCRGEPHCSPNFANPPSEFPIGSKVRKMPDCPEVYRR